MSTGYQYQDGPEPSGSEVYQREEEPLNPIPVHISQNVNVRSLPAKRGQMVTLPVDYTIADAQLIAEPDPRIKRVIIHALTPVYIGSRQSLRSNTASGFLPNCFLLNTGAVVTFEGISEELYAVAAGVQTALLAVSVRVEYWAD